MASESTSNEWFSEEISENLGVAFYSFYLLAKGYLNLDTS